MRRILEPADAHGFFVRIDMENSPYTEVHARILDTLWQQGHRHVGTVIQSYLKRSDDDIRRLNALGARVRLVKGAYKEPKTVAYQKKSDVDAAFVDLMRLLLDEGHYPAIATHDPAMIDATKAYAKSKGYAPIASSSRCCTASGAICRRRWSRKAIACGSTCRSASSGTRTSCDGSASGRRMSRLC